MAESYCDFHTAELATGDCSRCGRHTCSICALSAKRPGDCPRNCSPISPEVTAAFAALEENERLSQFSTHPNASPEPAAWTPFRELSPSMVLRQFADDLAIALASDDYRYMRSIRSFVRKRERWKELIVLETSRYNLQGTFVGCRLIARVENARLGDWRLENGSPMSSSRDVVADSDLRRLAWKRGLFQWDLAVESMWQEMLDHSTVGIRHLAEPWFAAFTPPADVLSRLRDEGIDHVQPVAAVELFLSRGDRLGAGSFVQSLQSRRPELWRAVVAALKGNQERGAGRVLAELLRHHGLDQVVLESDAA